ncbi:Little elongation complex subunit 2 [Mortierella sp. GBA35]|nr:Little elongation complex subunit 2 [Mortierella sp. GBA35]
MEKRVTRHSSAHATNASTNTAGPKETPGSTVNGSKRGRGRGRSGRGQASTSTSVGRGRGATRGRKCGGVSTTGVISASEEIDHGSDSDHAHDSKHETAQESDKDQEPEKEQEPAKHQELEKEKGQEPEKEQEPAKTQESEKEQEPANGEDHSEDEKQSEDGSSSDSDEGSDSDSDSDDDGKDSDTMKIDSEKTPPTIATTTKPVAGTAYEPQAVLDNMEEDHQLVHRTSTSGAFEEVSSLPFISPTFPPKFDAKEVEPMPLDNSAQPTITAPSSSTLSITVTSTTASSPKPLNVLSGGGFFLDEAIYNRISIGGTGRMTELFMFKNKKRERGASPEPGPGLVSDTDAAAPSNKKRRASGSVTVPNPTAATTHQLPASSSVPKPATTTTPADQTHSPTSTPVVAPVPPTNTVNFNDLVASVSSYKPEIESAVDRTNSALQPPVQQQPPQQQQSTIAAIKPADIRYHHPCIGAHQYRSSLTREEHRRYMMYDGVLRAQKKPGTPQLGQEDRALFALLQEKVEEERVRVRQWNDTECRSRVISYFNPLIRDALAPKFNRGRTRVKEEYPQYYDFVQSIGLRLPGVPSATKEPSLSRAQPKQPKSGAAEAIPNKPASGLRRRGLLHRTGKICPVSLAKPILPTDVNGVPYEKTIDVNDSYWNHSASSAPITDRRRGPMPVKRPAASVSKDPIAKEFVKEQNVHIALASSTMVALAKTLPSLANEWEIPVTVVLEEDTEGVMQKRIYVDKPLIPKRMTTLEVTQAFYDGALKKLSLIGSSSSDVSILEPRQDVAGAGPLASIAQPPSSQDKASTPTIKTDSEAKDVEMQDATDKQVEVKSPQNVDMTEAKDEESRKGDQPESAPTEEAAATSTDGTNTGNDEDEGVLGSQSAQQAGDEGSNDNFEYSLWTFGDLKLLIRNRLHGYLNNTNPYRQVVIKSILDYAPDIGMGEAGKSMMAGWWMATWVRDDRLLALGRVDVSKNQFVRYPEQVPPTYRMDNPLGGAFSDLPSISIKDTSALKVQDREVWDWIKPNMRLVHYILGKLQHLGPGQYILGHKRHDVSATVYRAVQSSLGEQSSDAIAQSQDRQGSSNNSKEMAGLAVHKGQYDLHAAHASSPQPLSDTRIEPSGGQAVGASGGGVDDDMLLRWIGTPDQIPGTFPYEPESDTYRKNNKRGRGGGGGGGSGGNGRASKRAKKGKGATKSAPSSESTTLQEK